MLLFVSFVSVAMVLYIDLLSNQYMFYLFLYINSCVISTGRWAHVLNHQCLFVDLYRYSHRFNTCEMNLYTYLLDVRGV